MQGENESSIETHKMKLVLLALEKVPSKFKANMQYLSQNKADWSLQVTWFTDHTDQLKGTYTCIPTWIHIPLPRHINKNIIVNTSAFG